MSDLKELMIVRPSWNSSIHAAQVSFLVVKVKLYVIKKFSFSRV
jgi:hypothetical protein